MDINYDEIISEIKTMRDFSVNEMLTDDVERKNQAKGSIAAFSWVLSLLEENLL